MEEIIIYARGLVCCSVCCPLELSKEEIEKYVNSQNPTGIESKWTISQNDFIDGSKNPHQCETTSKKLHYLLNC